MSLFRSANLEPLLENKSASTGRLIHFNQTAKAILDSVTYDEFEPYHSSFAKILQDENRKELKENFLRDQFLLDESLLFN